MTGPLAGIRIIEMAGLGPGPFAGMMLADHGAEVIRVERLGKPERGISDPAKDVLLRSRKRLAVDLKSEDGLTLVRALIKSADGLIEGFRPGVMERLGLGPDSVMQEHERLVYGRVTGWGQTGPLAGAAGHDINYIALSGALHAFGRAGAAPAPPANVAGDFGGGGMMLAFAMLAALLHVQRGGRGQVIDCAMTEGSALLMAMIWGFRAMGQWRGPRGTNLLDTGAHFYESYETADGKWIALGAIEPQFYALLRDKLGLNADPDFDARLDSACWEPLKKKLAALFLTRTRDAWCALLEGSDACFAPVLDFDEVAAHPHNAARRMLVEADGVLQPAPAPRYSGLPTVAPRMAGVGSDSGPLFEALGYGTARIDALRRAGVVD
jgi:alpha-methylacyl-CoA racemase